MNKKEIIIATKNNNKAKEYKLLLSKEGYSVKTLRDYPSIPDIPETAETFEGNAALKAEAISEMFGIPVIADDSGLCVDALDGAPGVYSARFAPNTDKKIKKLLGQLKAKGLTSSPAKYVTVIALAEPGKETKFFRGEQYGKVHDKIIIGNGFSYDRIFFDDYYQKNVSELNLYQKSLISSRSKATEKLLDYFKNNSNNK